MRRMNPCREVKPLNPTASAGTSRTAPRRGAANASNRLSPLVAAWVVKKIISHVRKDQSDIPDQRHKTSVPISPSARFAASRPHQ
jgi:hypothetical protein